MEDRTGYSSHLSDSFRILRCGILFDGAEEVTSVRALNSIEKEEDVCCLWPAAWPVWLLGH
jgi:hypothetical protein